MPVDPAYFVLTKDIGQGDRVRFTKRDESGEGVVALVWLGIEEVVNIEQDDGRRLHVIPALGDTIEVIEKAADSGSSGGSDVR